MTPERTKEAFEACAALIKEHTGYETVQRMPTDEIAHLSEPGCEMGRAMCHLLFCCEEGIRLVEQERTEKAMRWLGFIQGAIWAAGLASLDILKRMNMPIEEITSFSCGTSNCDHVWDGPGIEGEREGGGGFSSATCSKCGVDAMTHSMWNGP